MPTPTPRTTLVYHAGALGDSVLHWPSLRVLQRAGEVTLASDPSRARLAAQALGVRALDAATLRALWSPEPVYAHPAGPFHLVRLCVGPVTPEQGACLLTRAAEMFPGARVSIARATADARRARTITEIFHVEHFELVNPAGAFLLHVGSGGIAKRWPLERFAQLASILARRAHVRVLAGEAELERFSSDERGLFESMGGRFELELPGLVDAIVRARAVVCGDCGPGHLAAQLGARVLSLFGPTDPRRWAPVGPGARVLAPAKVSAMTWLATDVVARALEGW